MSDTTSNTESSDRPSSQLNFGAFKVHVLAHKIDVTLWVIRILTIFFTIGYFIPVYWSSYNAYYKALLANAATSALRLHQRLGTVQFNAQFLAKVLLEDSCHYLFYSLIFLYVPPVTLVLLPILLFAILHASSYALTLLDTLGHNAWWGARLLISVVEFQSRNILRLISFTEIFLMPLTVFLVLMGKGGLLTPFIYYHFLVQRYSSRRNPYTRNMFHELRVVFESFAAKPNMPGFIRSFILFVINLTCKLAPPQVTAQPHTQ
ncbi:Krueppel homolog 2 [Agrilus planipennis]|uniref:Krueppel homolog 2 n=1 Tax=Agrilus planipennis TaxID=224129 RepID=A0A1W4XFU2_AGRPL|nr:Krueppel homolog 2 [Agrilus planipennis]XP_018331648.1 Krueppel homolog 2 [Agrilus planipennis]